MDEREGAESWRVSDGLNDEWREDLRRIACDEDDPPSLETENIWGSDEKTAHWDYCAWYRPVHFFGPDAGISIRELCVRRMFRRLAIRYRHIHKSRMQVWELPKHERMLTRAATLVYFFHEQFHHSMECLGFRLQAVLGTSAYLPYKDNVYNPLFGTDDCLEEALANANMWHRIGNQPYRAKLSPEYIRAVREQLEGEYPLDPPGYRMASHYLPGVGSFDLGHDRLLSQMREGCQLPRRPTSDWMPASHMSHPIFNVTSHFWAVVPDGVRSILPVNTFPKRTTSTDNLVSALKKLGYNVVKGGGKGSHKKLSQSDWPTLIIPGDRENLSPGVAKSTLEALGLNLNQLQAFLSDPKAAQARPVFR
jgi:predicted RNA binding protein YcfA (HicA-like mRNA interferase family)